MTKISGFKFFVIGFLIAVFIVPLLFIGNLSDERRERKESFYEQTGKIWGSGRTLAPPVLLKDPGSLNDIYRISDTFNVKGDFKAESRKKGRYQVPFYTADLEISGRIQRETSEKMFLLLPVSDTEHVKSISIQINNKTVKVVKNSYGFYAEVHEKFSDFAEYKIRLAFYGVDHVHFLPVSKEGVIHISSNWKDPNFTGSALPIERTINADGFSSVWSYSRDSNWTYNNTFLFNYMYYPDDDDTNKTLENETFGVKFIIPVDSYHLVDRVIKYGSLFIVLTFLAFFIFEIRYGKHIHPVQYIFIGAALTIFYLLLLSISEYTGFTPAYAIATAAVTSMIYLYSKILLEGGMKSNLLGAGLLSLYGSLYVLINLEELSLLIGSVALFMILGIVMYTTRKVDWYKIFSFE